LGRLIWVADDWGNDGNPQNVVTLKMSHYLMEIVLDVRFVFA